jgi:magnesium-transporting ATPase (P-type)
MSSPQVDKTNSKGFNIAIIIVFLIVFIIFVYNCVYFKAIIDSDATNVPGCSGSDGEQSLTMIYWFNIIMAIISICVLIWAIFKTLAPTHYEQTKQELYKDSRNTWIGQSGTSYFPPPQQQMGQVPVSSQQQMGQGPVSSQQMTVQGPVSSQQMTGQGYPYPQSPNQL